MIVMIIEHFKDGAPQPIRERFVRDGRMMPDDIVYPGSWIDAQNARYFLVMEAADAERLKAWTNCWDDLIDFEIIPILPSQEYWSQFE
jgi:Protein of unknown function (DUF3303)